MQRAHSSNAKAKAALSRGNLQRIPSGHVPPNIDMLEDFLLQDETVMDEVALSRTLQQARQSMKIRVNSGRKHSPDSPSSSSSSETDEEPHRRDETNTQSKPTLHTKPRAMSAPSHTDGADEANETQDNVIIFGSDTYSSWDSEADLDDTVVPNLKLLRKQKEQSNAIAAVLTEGLDWEITSWIYKEVNSFVLFHLIQTGHNKKNSPVTG